jgi:hypothetical protein
MIDIVRKRTRKNRNRMIEHNVFAIFVDLGNSECIECGASLCSQDAATVDVELYLSSSNKSDEDPLETWSRRRLPREEEGDVEEVEEERRSDADMMEMGVRRSVD